MHSALAFIQLKCMRLITVYVFTNLTRPFNFNNAQTIINRHYRMESSGLLNHTLKSLIKPDSIIINISILHYLSIIINISSLYYLPYMFIIIQCGLMRQSALSVTKVCALINWTFLVLITYVTIFHIYRAERYLVNNILICEHNFSVNSEDIRMVIWIGTDLYRMY